jgi:hypothetical protein
MLTLRHEPDFRVLYFAHHSEDARPEMRSRGQNLKQNGHFFWMEILD